MNAFMAGVREVKPDAEFQVSFIGSWFDPPKAKETAYAMIENGADLLYGELFGVSDAAAERGVAIGSVIDTQPDYPGTVVAPALWNFQPTLDKAVEEIRAGRFRPGDYGIYSSMREGGAVLAPLGTFEDRIPPEALDLVEQRRQEIIEGTFIVEVDDDEPKSS